MVLWLYYGSTMVIWLYYGTMALYWTIVWKKAKQFKIYFDIFLILPYDIRASQSRTGGRTPYGSHFKIYQIYERKKYLWKIFVRNEERNQDQKHTIPMLSNNPKDFAHTHTIERFESCVFLLKILRKKIFWKKISLRNKQRKKFIKTGISSWLERHVRTLWSEMVLV